MNAFCRIFSRLLSHLFMYCCRNVFVRISFAFILYTNAGCVVTLLILYGVRMCVYACLLFYENTLALFWCVVYVLLVLHTISFIYLHTLFFFSSVSPFATALLLFTCNVHGLHYTREAKASSHKATKCRPWWLSK